MNLLRSPIKCQRGSALMEYLLLTVLISAIVVPIIISKFGVPFSQTMENERAKMVNFFAQTPKSRQKPPVPASWFSQELPAKVESGQLNEAGSLGEPPPLETGEINGGQNIQSGELQANDQALSSGSGMRTGQIRGGGVQAGGGSSSQSGGSEFFSAPTTPGLRSDNQKTSETVSVGAKAPRTGGGWVAEEDGSGQGPISRAQNNTDKKQKAGQEESELLTGKKGNLSDTEREIKQRERSKKFDWWLLIKILIIFGILVLLVVIILGSAKKDS